MSPTKDRSLEIFYRRRKRCKKTFPCPGCAQIVSSVDYENNHSASCLKLDRTLECVWCLGKKSWDKYEKHKHVNHLLECWDVFINEKAIPPPPPPPPPPPEKIVAPKVKVAKQSVKNLKCMKSKHTCRKKRLFGRSKISTLPRSAYDSIFLMELIYTFFTDKNFNAAAASVLLFLGGGHEFYHVMVRAVAYKSFYKAMKGGPARVFLLV